MFKITDFFLLFMVLANLVAAEECVLSDLGVTLQPGEHYNSKEHCVDYICGPDIDTQSRRCAIPMVAEGCKIIDYDLTKHYPECCPKVEC